MIISKILGGLGNQIFQYALGVRIAIDQRDELVLDIADFKTYRRPYFLDRFTIKAGVLDEVAAEGYRKYQKRFSIYRWVEERRTLAKRMYREEKISQYYQFLPEVLCEGPETIYLSGYWQNIQYFETIRSRLVEDIVLRPEYQISKEHELLQTLKEKEVIAVHFRRGEDQLTKPMYGVPKNDYYLSAIREIASRRSNLHVFIFSNEIEWVKANFSIDLPVTYVSDGYGLQDFQEFELMRLCHHHVIANSTFSWWAAWLSTNEHNITFAPKRWLNAVTIDTSGIIPARWNVL